MIAVIELNRVGRQREVARWVLRTFGQEFLHRQERAARLLEEAAEAAQSVGLHRTVAESILGRVFSRPIGHPAQEIGGVAITLMAFAESIHEDVEHCETVELQRILDASPLKFRAKQNEKADLGIALRTML